MTREVLQLAFAPAAGFAVDKYGTRPLIAGSAINLGISVMLLSQTQSLWQFILFFGVLGGFGVPGLSGGVISPMVSKWFIRKRGQATGIATAGLNVGAVAMTPVILFLISQYGWRQAWLVLGFVLWIIIVPPALIWLRREPEDIGMLPYGDDNEPSPSGGQGDPRESTALPPVTNEISWTAREAFGTPVLWLILAYNFFTDIAISGGVVLRIPYMTDLGFSNTVAGTTFVVYGVFAFFAKIGWGYLSDRYPIRCLAIAVVLGSALGLSFIIEATTVWQLYLGYGVVYGLTGGSLVVVAPLIWANYFGRRYQGSIQGLTRPFRLVSSVGGPMFAAIVYDTTKSYQFVFYVFVGCFGVAAFLIWLAKPPLHPSLATPTADRHH